MSRDGWRSEDETSPSRPKPLHGVIPEEKWTKLGDDWQWPVDSTESAVRRFLTDSLVGNRLRCADLGLFSPIVCVRNMVVKEFEGDTTYKFLAFYNGGAACAVVFIKKKEGDQAIYTRGCLHLPDLAKRLQQISCNAAQVERSGQKTAWVANALFDLLREVM